MCDAQFKSSQPISSFTVADLKKLVEEIVDKRLQQKLEVKPLDSPPPIFLETFGSWEDDRSAEEIIADLYSNSSSEVQA